MMLSWKLWLGVGLLVVGLIGANVWQLRQARHLSASIGQLEQSNKQLASDLQAERGQVSDLIQQRDREASIRAQRDDQIRAIQERHAAARRAWQQRLDDEAGGWMAADIPDVVDERLCELVPCAGGANRSAPSADTQ